MSDQILTLLAYAVGGVGGWWLHRRWIRRFMRRVDAKIARAFGAEDRHV